MLDRPRGPGALLALFLSAASLFLPSSAAAHIPRAALDATPTSAERLDELRSAGHVELREKSHLGVALEDAAHCLITSRCKSRRALGKVGWLGRDPRRAHFFFQGRELDPVTGLYDFRNRWYSPELGRWLTRDPLGYPDGPNQYAAFGGDPANSADPFGLSDVRTLAAALDHHLPVAEISATQTTTEMRALASLAASVSLAGDVKDWQEVVTGRDYVAGQPLTRSERAVTAVAGVVPVVGGKALRGLLKRAGILEEMDDAAHLRRFDSSFDDVPALQLDEIPLPRRGRAPTGEGGNILANKSKGDAFEARIADEAEASQRHVKRQITVETPSGETTRIDIVGQDPSTGEVILTEAKGSPTAPLTRQQRRTFPEIEESGAVVRGAGKPPWTGGTQIPPTRVRIRRP